MKFWIILITLITSFSFLQAKIRYDREPNNFWLDIKKIAKEFHPPVIDAKFCSKCGWRKHPIYRKRRWHYGVDLCGKQGTPLYAMTDGTVEIEKRLRGWGRVVHLHTENFTIVYAHCRSFKVRNNQKVKKGDIIAIMGKSGNAQTPHLHIEIRKGYKAWLRPDLINKLMKYYIDSKPITAKPTEKRESSVNKKRKVQKDHPIKKHQIKSFISIDFYYNSFGYRTHKINTRRANGLIRGSNHYTQVIYNIYSKYKKLLKSQTNIMTYKEFKKKKHELNNWNYDEFFE